MRAPILASLAVAASCTHSQTIGDGRALVGSRVVVEATPGVEQEGVVVQDANGITVSTVSGDLALWNVHSITEVKRARGALEGLGLGILIGGGGGVLLGLADGDDVCEPDARDCYYNDTAGEKAAILGVLFGGLGGIIGLVAGALRGSRDVYELAGTAPAARFVPSGPPGSSVGATIRF
jgi:hypothetical protein